MDLGIAGRWAIICASSQGPGRACAEALAAEGANIVVHGCEPETVERAAAEIAATYGVMARAATGDFATQKGRDRLLDAWSEPDILVTGNFQLELDGRPERADDLADALRLNYLEQQYWAPVAMVQAVIGGMRSRRFGRIVNITATAPTRRSQTAAPGGERDGMTAVMRGLAARAADDNVTVNQLVTGVGPAGLAGAGRRRGHPELGAACAILCSAQAACISGADLRVSHGSRALELAS